MHAVHAPESDAELLAGIDLNLIVAFDALARERSVTRAASRVGITQSAMSHALGRLRTLVGDPLLVRTRGGMVLTPRAEALVVPIRSALVAISRALSEPARFDPASARRAFSLAMPDLFDVLVTPRLLSLIRTEAPGIDISTLPLDPRGLADRLETGELDVAVVPKIEQRDLLDAAGPGLLRRTLFRDRFTCFLRAGHPALRKKGSRRRARSLSLSTYASLSHAIVSPSGQGPSFVDDILEQQGIKRRVVLRTPHFYSALAIIAKTDLILTAPTSLIRLASSDLAIVSVRAPIALPEHSLNLVWHERFSNDPGHEWLREHMVKVTREISPP